MAELDGPRLEPRSGPARQLVVFLHGYGADGNDLIDIGRAWQGLLPDAAFVSPHAPRPCGQAPTGREWFPLTFRDPDERWDGVNAAAPGLERLPRRRTQAPQSAALRAGAGRLQPGHHDGAACRPAPRGRRRRRSSAIPACWSCRTMPTSEAFAAEIKSAAAGAADPRRRGPTHSGAGAVPCRARRWPRSRCRSNGTSRPASATASTRKACARAANFCAKRFASRANSRPLAGNPPPRLHNPVTLPYILGVLAAWRQHSRRSRSVA